MPTKADFERKKYAKDILQPFKKTHKGKVEVNEKFVKEYGTEAYEDGANNDVKNYYDKRLASDPKLIHKNNSIIVPKIEYVKRKKTGKDVCGGSFGADGNGGLKEPCLLCGKKSFDHKNLY